ncbi:MAG: hypothetical protein ACRC7Q_10110, partial [Plesiomonas shigelloides]
AENNNVWLRPVGDWVLAQPTIKKSKETTIKNLFISNVLRGENCEKTVNCTSTWPTDNNGLNKALYRITWRSRRNPH